MARNSKGRLPKLGRHSSGQARVTLNGRVHYCGAWGSVDAQRRYVELVERWEANGRRPLDEPLTVVQVRRVRDLLDDYMAYLDAAQRYHRDGKPTDGRRVCKLALDEFAAACGDVHAAKLTDVLVRRHRDSLEARRT